MSDQERDYAAIRRNVEKGVAREKWLYRIIFFVTHLIIYVVTMLAVWGTVLANPQLRDTLFNGQTGAGAVIILPTVLWAFVLLCHLAALYVESDVAEKEIRERLLMREVGEEFLRKGLVDDDMADKPKRQAEASEVEAMRLSDDGELIPVDEDKRHLRI